MAYGIDQMTNRPDISWAGISESERIKNLENDFREVLNFPRKLKIRLKLAYYFFARPIRSFFIRRFLSKKMKNRAIIDGVDLFLPGDSGLYKKYIYSVCNCRYLICEKFGKIKDSTVLVAGAGYGRNVFQLAALGPKKIVGFDPLDFSKEWEILSKKISESFGAETDFFQGDFSAVAERYPLGHFDFVFSDAVLMHVRDVEEFARQSSNFLKDKGIFYADWGPPWFGPRGDMLNWEDSQMFNHLVLEESDYRKEAEELLNKPLPAGYKEYFKALIKEKPFSFLKTERYLDIFKSAGLEKKLLFARINLKAADLLEKNPIISEILDSKNIPEFDRYCGGMIIWAQKNNNKL